MLVEPSRIDAATEHMIDQWMTSEACAFYVKERRAYCTFLQLLDYWMHAPLCLDCALSQPLPHSRLPDVSPPRWQNDLSWAVGATTLRRTRRALREDPEFAYRCKRCRKLLRPWAGDELYVVSYHLEDHYRFPLVRTAQVEPSNQVKEHIKHLYRYRCFGCRRKRPLHIDHVLPRSKGGDAAFRNLQPLCEHCGDEKGDREPEEVTIYSDMYFGPYPSDGYEGLFW